MQNYNSKVKGDLRDRCYEFGLNIITLTYTLPNRRSAWIIQDQLIRAATSIGANLIEARASSSRLEFKKFFEISLKCANKTKYWLSLLKDTRLASETGINNLMTEVTELANMLASAVITLKSRKL